jgi:hypothetical protein
MTLPVISNIIFQEGGNFENSAISISLRGQGKGKVLQQIENGKKVS